MHRLQAQRLPLRETEVAEEKGSIKTRVKGHDTHDQSAGSSVRYKHNEHQAEVRTKVNNVAQSSDRVRFGHRNAPPATSTTAITAASPAPNSMFSISTKRPIIQSRLRREYVSASEARLQTVADAVLTSKDAQSQVEVVEGIARRLGVEVQTAVSFLVTNRKQIATRVALSCAAAAVCTLLVGVDLSSAVGVASTVATSLNVLGVDQFLFRKISDVAAGVTVMVGQDTRRPLYWLEQTGAPRKLYDITLAELIKQATTESLTFANSGSVQTYFIGKGVYLAQSGVRTAIQRVFATGRSVAAVTSNKSNSSLAREALQTRVSYKYVRSMRNYSTVTGSASASDDVSSKVVIDVDAAGVGVGDDKRWQLLKRVKRDVQRMEDTAAMKAVDTYNVLRDDLQQDQMPVPNPLAQSADEAVAQQLGVTSKKMRVAQMLGVSMVNALVSGQTIGNVDQVRSLVIQMIDESVGFTEFINRYSTLFTQKTLAKFIDINQQLVNSSDEANPNTTVDELSVKQRVLGLLLGETVFDPKAIQEMSAATIESFMDRQGIRYVRPAYTRFATTEQVNQAWRALLIDHQKQKLQITVASLVQITAVNGLSAIVAQQTNRLVKSYQDTIFEVLQSETLSTAAGLSMSERVTMFTSNVYDVIGGPNLLAAPVNAAQDALRKINDMLTRRPDILDAINNDPLLDTSSGEQSTEVEQQNQQNQQKQKQQDDERVAQDKAREATLRLYQLERQQRLQKVAERYHISPEQMTGVKTMADLQSIVYNQLSQTEARTVLTPQLDVETGVHIRTTEPSTAEYGSLTNEQILSPQIEAALKNLDFQSLYNVFKSRAAPTLVAASTSWIPGVGAAQNIINGLNTGISGLNTGKAIFNLLKAVNDVTGESVNETLTSLPYAPSAPIKQYFNPLDALGEVEKTTINGYEILMRQMLDQIQNGADHRRLIENIAKEVVGSRELNDDVQYVIDSFGARKQ